MPGGNTFTDEQSVTSRSSGSRLSAWKVATSTCPHCVGEEQARKEACVACDGTGDLFRSLLEEQRRKGREEGLAALRELHGVITATGRHVRDLPMPDVRSEAGW